MKILHTADLQFGAPNQPKVYYTEPINALSKFCRDNDIGMVLIAGDVFDHPAPSQRHKDLLIEQFIANEDILFVLSVGNHDVYKTEKTYGGLNTFKILHKHLKNVAVLDGDEKGIEYKIHPYEKEFKFLSLMGDWDKLCPKKQSGTTIAVWHGEVPGVLNGDSGAATEFIKKYNLSYLALGHIHKRISFPGGGYPGAIIPKTYVCEHGVYILDTEKLTRDFVPQSSFLDLPLRYSFKVEIDAEDSEQTIVDAIEKQGIADGSLIKIKLSVPMSKWKTIATRSIIEKLNGKFLEVKITNDVVPERDQRKNAELIYKAKSFEEEMSVIFDSMEIDSNFDRDRLMKECCGWFNNAV
ncbi:MAG: metallophosphoesterase [Candidatus Paceibacterota bacterium]